MQKAAYITGMLLMLVSFTACRNAAGGKEMSVQKPAANAHLKDTELALTPAVLEYATAKARDFYTAHNNTTAWTDKKDRTALLKAIENASADGLLPSDYNISILQDFEDLKSITPDECMRYDLMLTQAFINLSTHLFKGKLKPVNVYSTWSLIDKPFDAPALLTEALQNHNIQDAIIRCRPRHATYAALCNSFAMLNALPDDTDLPKINLTKKVRLNDTTAVVTTIQQRLKYWGDLKTDSLTHIYDKATAVAVKHFQRRHGLSANGVVNDKTAKALNISRDKRREQVVANLERWRWFAYDFGEKALVINIPDYKMVVLENGKDTLETYNVVVGKPERKTPVLQSAINAVILNPTWTVPPTIIEEDLTPAATKNRGYFARHNMKIYKDTNEITPEEWKPEKFNSYRYVQAPGVNNSLGLVKFNFNSRYSVYLHDTNHRDLFVYGYRALSSGCVRVEDPMKLAEYVLGNHNKDWNREKIDSITAAGETKNVYIKKSIQVHQLYWTAWMDNNGLQFRDDIYSLDKTLYNKLRQKL